MEEAISSIIVDGYNLIGILHKDLEKARERLIQALIRYSEEKNHRIFLVFDGWKSGSIKEEHIVRGGISIIFSKLGERADSVIKRIISTDRREWIVISSDRDVAASAWRYGSIPVQSEAFYERLIAVVEGIREGEDNGEDDLLKTRKGRSSKLSKKEKAIRRALSKL